MTCRKSGISRLVWGKNGRMVLAASTCPHPPSYIMYEGRGEGGPLSLAVHTGECRGNPLRLPSAQDDM